MAAQARFLDKDGATVLSLYDWGALVSGASEVDADRVKRCVTNISSRALGISPFGGVFLLAPQQIGTGDGFGMSYTAADPNATLSRPWGDGVDSTDAPNGSPEVADGGAGGAWGATGLHGVVVVARKGATVGLQSTTPCVEAVFNVGDVAVKKTYTWVGPPTGADKFDVYVTDSPGTYGATTYAGTVNGDVFTFTHDGTVAAGTPSTTNTSGGAAPDYGTPPSYGSFGQASLTIATAGGGGLAIGQQWFHYITLKIPAGKSEVGNKRSYRTAVREI